MCATVHPSISAPFACAYAAGPPTGCSGPSSFRSSRHCFHFRAFFFSRSRDKSLTLPFSLLPILITTTTTCVSTCHRQRMEGLPSRGLYQLWTVSIHPPQRFFFHSQSIFPNSLISRFHCHLPPHMAEAHPGRRSDSRLLSTTFYLTNSA
ncbi:hypothetical protein TRIATDRAFT_298217 [Trichoderma atroviride IMI 206040]|uniref:Uncharacterized protein n=1 Tax=Hypocrea atroviridis (strain ATCC 20476 / IMI 206040) TaxID=452589 RepID=G9NM59_HYPAI|nr:uncharacterized protein TRIATDRAFT_298217 [Trichoderma atroviride IMI 206040]EHK47991.1 hypothetical protein TRIATDRAFT_298217 [Trichoderma atroviride IMI 206040]